MWFPPTFRTAYVDHTATMVRDGPKIARHYLATWFTVDLLACIPFDLVTRDASHAIPFASSLLIAGSINRPHFPYFISPHACLRFTLTSIRSDIQLLFPP